MTHDLDDRYEDRSDHYDDRYERHELLAEGPAQGLAGLLGVPLPPLTTQGLPALWHWVYLLDRPAQADLGRDGHPVRGVLPVPPGPGLRRMWAGGRVSTLRPLVTGRPASRISTIAGTRETVGRTGAMTFVTVRHEVVQDDQVAVVDEQDIVYRQPPPPEQHLEPHPEPHPEQHGQAGSGSDEAPEAPVAAGDWVIETSSTLLARYSALTYNGHRIHYDRDFTRNVEGYPGLLVHGPLQATAMAEAARSLLGGAVVPGSFDYRLLAPLFDHQGMVVTATRSTEYIEPGIDDAGQDQIVTQVRDRTGRPTAQGRWVCRG
ncbi:MAG: mesaconyl-C4 CoA hydratase [Austwickia sp.]|nr:mesaconyl-C4 CoA hydratase [Austwickia sp.]